MGSTEVKRGQKRVNLPSSAEQDVVDLSVQLLIARSGTVFGRGFRLRAIGQRLYVQLSGLKAPLYLDYDAAPNDVQARGIELRAFLVDRSWQFDSDAWRDACSVSRARKGKPEKRRLNRDEVIDKWLRLKRAEGVGETTIRRTYMAHLLRLDSRHPLSEDSLLRAIEQTAPRSASRRRLVPMLRRICAVCGSDWNAALLDPLQNSGKAISHRPQSFFTDEQIEAFMAGEQIKGPSWRRVVALMAIYGLRPWEAWIAEPCKERRTCIWVGKGKVGPRGANRPRQVPPFHREWLELFEMERLWRSPLPQLNSLTNAGHHAAQALTRYGVLVRGGPSCYGFRHAYARRLHSPRYRVVDTHAALFLGHTVAVHHQTYRSWLGGEDPIDLYLESPG